MQADYINLLMKLHFKDTDKRLSEALAQTLKNYKIWSHYIDMIWKPSDYLIVTASLK